MAATLKPIREVPEGSPGAILKTRCSNMQPITATSAAAECTASMEELPIAHRIGATVRAVRLAKGLSQGDMEKRTGLLRCYISRIENGYSVPSLETLSRMAEGLGVPLAELFGEAPSALKHSAPELGQEDLAFLCEVQRFAAELGKRDRALLLDLIRRFAASKLV